MAQESSKIPRRGPHVCVLCVCCCTWTHAHVRRHYRIYLWLMFWAKERHDHIFSSEDNTHSYYFTMPNAISHSETKVEGSNSAPNRMESKNHVCCPTYDTYKSLLVSSLGTWALGSVCLSSKSGSTIYSMCPLESFI